MYLEQGSASALSDCPAGGRNNLTALCCPWPNEVLEAQEDLLGGQEELPELPPAWKSFTDQGRAVLPELCTARGTHGKAEKGRSSVQSHWRVLVKSSHLLPCLESSPEAAHSRGHGLVTSAFHPLCAHLSSEFPCMERVVTLGQQLCRDLCAA